MNHIQFAQTVRFAPCDIISVGRDVIVFLAISSPSLQDSSWSITEALSYRFLAPAVTVGEQEGAMDSTSVFFLPITL